MTPSMPNTILFICTGNYYRSRYAEIYFNHLASRLHLDWQATSSGLEAKAARNPGPISQFTLERLAQRGISPGKPIRFPIQLEEKDLQDASLVIALNRVEHHRMMQTYFPAWAEKITYWGVADLDFAKADDALSVIEQQVSELATELATRRNP